MATMVHDLQVEESLHAARKATGADRYDEVWEGVYMMAAMPTSEYQRIVTELVAILHEVLGRTGQGDVLAGVNLSDRDEDWTEDYRIPDIAVALKTGKSRDLETHWVGPADFLVEVLSPGDQSRDKIPFYSRLGVRELFVIDRDPWGLELYQHDGSGLALNGSSTLEQDDVLNSSVTTLTFQLVEGDDRPQIRVRNAATDSEWLV